MLNLQTLAFLALKQGGKGGGDVDRYAVLSRGGEGYTDLS